MQTDNRFFDDLARVANGALHTVSGVRDELETRLKERVERWLGEMDMVPREEFEAIKEVAQTARGEQEKLFARVEILERQLADLLAADRQKAPAKKAAAPRRRAAKTKTAD